jgi:hypothetical protein
MVEVTDSDKNIILLLYGINYDHKKFIYKRMYHNTFYGRN